MKKSLNITSANLLYLVSMLLVIVVGSVVQMLHLSLGLIATEVFLIALPAMLFLRKAKVPFKKGLRLNRISLPVAAVSLLLGVSTYLFSVLIELVMANLTGLPSVDLSQSAMPQSTWQYVLYFVAIAISAPICEEILFRGAIQGAYEQRKSVAFAISVPALMFAFYHFRLTGLPGLLPVAFLVGYVAWCSRSIFSTMLLHFGMNASSATITILALSGSKFPDTLFGNYWFLAAGLAVTLVLLFIFIRLQPKPEAYEPVEDVPAGWFKKYWTLMIAGILYTVVVGATLVAQLSGATANTTLNYFAPKISTPVESHYQIVNKTGDVVGEMDCRITPNGDTFNLDCEETVQPYEVNIGNSMWSDSGHSATLHVVWESSTFKLLQYSKVGTYDSGGEQKSELKDSQLVTTSFFDTYDPLPLTGDPLLEQEWAWKVNDLDGTGGPLFKTPFVYLMRWDNELKKSQPVMQHELLELKGNETITLPAGEFETWKVTLGSQSAWYALDETRGPRPVKFDDGMLTYLLMK